MKKFGMLDVLWLMLGAIGWGLALKSAETSHSDSPAHILTMFGLGFAVLTILAAHQLRYGELGWRRYPTILVTFVTALWGLNVVIKLPL